MAGKRQKRCVDGYGAKSLRIMRKAKEHGMHLRRDGKVVLPTGKIHIGTPQWGRDRINLSVDGERISIQTARVVCFLAYGTPPAITSVADHVNGNTKDDSMKNLRWATYSENCRNRRITRQKTFEQRANEGCLGIRDPATTVPELVAVLQEVAASGIPFDDPRLKYVSVQISRVTINDIQAVLAKTGQQPT